MAVSLSDILSLTAPCEGFLCDEEQTARSGFAITDFRIRSPSSSDPNNVIFHVGETGEQIGSYEVMPGIPPHRGISWQFELGFMPPKSENTMEVVYDNPLAQRKHKSLQKVIRAHPFSWVCETFYFRDIEGTPTLVMHNKAAFAVK
ncbi:GMP phosphodiesterase, delta subunit [Kipferlia bialata]|uniref:GMP phosphodiesterase, delta subunit n=1 Tax=Kipferlia bialata TaxID=797122 RepID=A0A9K3CNU5_9EUKA|nr:GMP phosphodiesterase, delta subunit [Kipferlia bialata]|eukprot:g211.t1